MGRSASWISGIFRHLHCNSLSPLNLLRVKVTSSCSAGQGTEFYNLSRSWCFLSSFFAVIFAFFPNLFDNFWQCPPHYAVQHNLKKKKLNFHWGQMSSFLEWKWRFGLQAYLGKRGKLLCEESCSRSTQYGLWLQVICLCFLSFTPARSKGKVTTAERESVTFLEYLQPFRQLHVLQSFVLLRGFLCKNTAVNLLVIMSMSQTGRL